MMSVWVSVLDPDQRHVGIKPLEVREDRGENIPLEGTDNRRRNLGLAGRKADGFDLDGERVGDERALPIGLGEPVDVGLRIEGDCRRAEHIGDKRTDCPPHLA